MQTLTPFTKITIAAGIASLLLATGCGTGGFTLLHPMGNYSNASLKGSYVYEVRGTSLVTGFPYREAGVFTADGAGHITAGIDDFEGFSASGSSTGLSGSYSGSYSVANDGTGSMVVGPTILGNISGTNGNQISFAITLVSSGKLELMDADNFAIGAGEAELQDSTAIGAAPAGTFVFRVHQEITASSTQAPASQVGGVSVASGAGSGAMDQNLGGTFTSPNVNWAFGAPNSLGSGAATLTDTSTGNTTNLFYYIVSSGEFKLLISDPSVVAAGGAEAQTGAVSGGLSGSYAFGIRGDDFFGLLGTVATVGTFTANAGSITGVEDSMQDGALTSSISFPGTCYSTGSAGGISGRVVVTNGSGTPCSGSVTEIFWTVSPSRVFFLDTAANTFEDGAADLQTASSFSASTLKGQFALRMDGWDLSGLPFSPPQVLGRIGVLQFDGSSKLTLGELANSSASGVGAQNPGTLAGPYSVSTNGRINGTVSNNGGGFGVVMYAVSGSRAYALQTDSGRVTSGIVELQH